MKRVIPILLISLLGVADEATEYLNSLRTGAGLIPFAKNALLDQSSQNHANYLKEENTFGHQESNTDNSYYTGEWANSRISHVGYDWSSFSENLSYGHTDVISSIDGLFQAIYHRFGFLSLNTNEYGYGVDASRGVYVYNMATQKPKYSNDIEAENPAIIKWPYSGYDKAQPAFFNTEYPAPLPECKRGGSSGNPISIEFNPSKTGIISIKSFKLLDSSGNEVVTKELEHNEYIDDNQFAFFPIDRLDWGSKYSANLAYSEDGSDKSITWDFQTRKLKYPTINADEAGKVYDVSINSTYAIYFKPTDCNDVSSGYSYSTHSGEERVERVDPNTYYITFAGSVGSDFTFTTTPNNKEYKFHYFTEELSDLSFSDVTSNSVTLKWSHTNKGEATGYKIYRDDKLIKTVSIDTMQYTDSDLAPNKKYKYTVKATNDI